MSEPGLTQRDFDVATIANKITDWQEDFDTPEDAARDIIDYLATENPPGEK